MAAGRIVLVTGASSGIGRATAVAFARRGDTVVLAARSATSLESAAQECRALGATAVPVVTDVGDDAAVTALFDDAVTRFGRIDVVVNAAAVVGYGRFSDVPADVFDRVIQTNVIGTANVARAALQQFSAAGGGSLILVGSLLGKIAVPLMSPYVTSKWAVHGLARIIQIEARQLTGVHVTLVSPGSVNTPAYSQAANYTGWEGRPPPPVDPPEKVAAAIVKAADRPRRDRSVGIANEVVVLGFRLLPAVYDVLVTPLVRLAALSRTPVPAHSGSVFEPRPAGDDQHGKWGRHWIRKASAGVAVVGAGVVAVATQAGKSKPAVTEQL